MGVAKRAVLVSVVLVLLAFITACSSQEAPPGPTAAPSQSPSPSATAPSGDLLKFERAGGGLSCVESGGEVVALGLWDDTMIASTPLRITGVRAIGRSVRIAGGLVAPVVGGLPEVSGISDWPPGAPERTLAKSLDWEARTQVVGAHLDVQRAVLPFLHLVAKPGGTLSAIELAYRTDAGQAGSVRVDRVIRFARGRC
jgi:hypothetical protein